MPIWPQFHCPLSIDIDSGSGESMYYGHVLVFFGVNENSKMALRGNNQWNYSEQFSCWLNFFINFMFPSCSVGS